MIRKTNPTCMHLRKIIIMQNCKTFRCLAYKSKRMLQKLPFNILIVRPSTFRSAGNKKSNQEQVPWVYEIIETWNSTIWASIDLTKIIVLASQHIRKRNLRTWIVSGYFLEEWKDWGIFESEVSATWVNYMYNLWYDTKCPPQVTEGLTLHSRTRTK